MLRTAFSFFPLLALAATPPEWSRPYPPFRIAGNVYYVGTEDLACYLITGKAGHILLNTGLEDSPKMIVASIEKLGFKPGNIRILLTSQAHYDHAAGFAEMQRITKAKVYATPPDAKLLENGAKTDPADLPQFAPVKVDRTLRDGEVIRLGEIALKTIYTFGHTQGSSSYEMTVTENGQRRTLLFANMATVVMPLANPRYPEIADDFRRTFAVQEKQRPDIWVAAHASQFDMQRKQKAGSFADPEGFPAAVAKYKSLFLRQVKIELGQ
jgi:metallo-beta-lactamase class B